MVVPGAGPQCAPGAGAAAAPGPVNDLAAFLGARLDQDEAAANDERLWFNPYPNPLGEFEGWLVIQQEHTLRDVAAKRAILAECQPRPGAGIAAIEIAAQRILRLLAAVYSDHPDYRDEWKP